MSKSPEDTSSISFTALYTGHVWYANGLSSPAFHTRRGSLFFHALAPFEYIGKKIAGGDIKTFLLQRHHVLDRIVSNAIEQEGISQILEIACGLSPRGTRYCERYPELNYIEADLPGMAARKHKLLSQNKILSERHQVVPLNIFSQGSVDSLENVIKNGFDQSKPLLVITEGLVNYFNLDSISPFWQRLSQILKQFPLGIYLTDNYPLLDDHPFRNTMKSLGSLLGGISRSQVSFHFGSDAQCQQHFQEMGFKDTNIHNPKDYYGQLDIPKSRGEPFVRLIEARTESPAP